MRKVVLLATAAVTAVLAVLPMTTASAATVDVLTISKVGGTNVAVGAILKANLKTGTKATFFSPGTRMGVSCKQATVTDKVTANPAKPGTAGESLTAQTFTKCTTNIAGATGVKSVKVLSLPYTTALSDAAGFPITVTKPGGALKTTIVVNSTLGAITCTYKDAKLSGSASNTGSVNAFTNQVFKLSSGSAACLAKGSFSATFGPLQDTSVTGNPAVFVN